MNKTDTRPSPKRSWIESTSMYFKDADKTQIVLILRTLGVFLALYTPFGIFNDALGVFLGPLVLIDDFTLVPLGIAAAVKTVLEIRKYRDPSYGTN